MAIAFSSSVSFARFVAPIVSVCVLVTLAKLLRISTRALSVNFVEAEMSKDTFIPVMWISVREEQERNIYDMSVTFEVSKEGTEVREEQ